ncbi:cytosine deaminase [Cognatiyoonia sp. IB215182]|uniref:cytosine deaminase n=1 Tax=Cognatiyoonia sp. IB215182 TaxID=3097353 RepID=UPI002A14713C|nr:cytosine deaminase [Cognatiyoonia sp. IB215182]MDX8353804.1 cytosine deaminase [Cognatiyoonia sp. IB215182]
MPLPTIPDGPVQLDNLRLPAACLGAGQGLVETTLTLASGQIVDAAQGAAQVDMRGAIAFPAFVDMHTHLDKGHIWPRNPNPDGSFEGALGAVRRDTAANWSAPDVRARMEFSLRCAYAHGTRAIRTHLDSHAPQDAISWGVFPEVRAAWADKIDLQAVCLVACDYALTDEFVTTADLVAGADGVLGMVTYPGADLQAQLDTFFAAAEARGLAADFHVDETMDPTVNTLRDIAQTVIDRGFDQPVVVGHLCSLSVMDEAEALHTLDVVARAGLHVVSLPMCNMYLQDRHAARTPRNRGITLVHEMVARGIPVSFASDNTRDPFYAYGDMDMLEVMREATRIGHLDHSVVDWTRAYLQNPATACGFAPPSLKPGAPDDLVICNARSWTELFARPQSDRIVIRGGQQIDRTLPDYAELDHLMETA